MEVDGKTFKTYKEAGAEILEFSDKYMEINKEYHLGTYRGFEIVMTNLGMQNIFENNGKARKVITIKSELPIQFDLLKIPSLNIKKLDQKLDGLEQQLEMTQDRVKDLYRQEEQCKEELQKPFEFAEKLKELLQKKREIDEELKLDDEKNLELIADESEENNSKDEDETSEDFEVIEEYEEEEYI